MASVDEKDLEENVDSILLAGSVVGAGWKWYLGSVLSLVRIVLVVIEHFNYDKR